MFTGTIILESLISPSIIDGLNVTNTEVETVTDSFGTPWLKQWTLKTVEIDDNKIEAIAEQISRSIDPAHANSWFADFANEAIHYVIFKDKVFKIDRTNPSNYTPAKQYAFSLGIPAHQLGFLKLS